MLTLKKPLDYKGAMVVEVYLGVGETLLKLLKEAGRENPRMILLTALVDTGAHRTVIDERFMEDLNLPPLGEVDVHTASTGENPVKRKVSAVNLVLAENITVPLADDLKVIAADHLGGLGVQMLLGRDVMSRLHVYYDGPRQQFSLQFQAPAPEAP
jgi:predicted aspartyl protease